MIHGPQRVVVPEVPLAEDAGAVSRRSEHLRQRYLVRPHHRAADVGIDHARAVVVTPGEQARARGRADGAHVKLSELHALSGDPIHVGRMDLVISVDAEVAPSLIVRDDQHHVRPPRACLRRERRCRSRQ
jgi:hypothetical protein